MRIAIIHYRYYKASGPEKYLFEISKLLENHGHTIIPFSLNYDENLETPFSEYFPNPVVKEFHVSQNKVNISFQDKLKIIGNTFYNKEAFTKLSRLLKEQKPVLVYVLQYGNKLSTSIFKACSLNNIPVVLRLSDFNLLCAKNTFFRNGETCTKCLTNQLSSIRYKCVHNSISQSSVYYLSQKYNQLKHFEKQIDAFVAPSKFTQKLLRSSRQFKQSNIFHIPTFINESKGSADLPKHNYNVNTELKLCYLGRIAEDKGVDLLIDAINVITQKGLKIKLDIIGDLNSEFAKNQIIRSKDLGLKNISFRGYVPNEKIHHILKESHYSVIPSKWFDNMPNSLIESCLAGVPVLASKIGSLEELIKNGFNGFTFEAFNQHSLASLIESLYFINSDDYKKLSDNAKNWIEVYCNQETHYKSLLDVFNKVIYEKSH